MLKALVHFFVLKRICWQLARGNSQRAERLGGELFVNLHNLGSTLVAQRPLLFAHEFQRTSGDENVRALW